ncbi:MAG TPA: hypothetical protein VGT41_05985, partial [Candidatus Babeliales bacterium]|nr:hypothetical protein [Candidatus Babeliales bacterium]
MFFKKTVPRILTLFLAIGFILFITDISPTYATLSCSVTTAVLCTSPSVVIVRMSSTTNAHAELPSQVTANYANSVICCTGVTSLSNTCTNSFAIAVKLVSTTNSHVEQNTNSNYSNNACISAPIGTMTVAYQDTNCTGYDTTLGSMAS